MKGFTKLALVSAIAALPMTGFAMEALDDATMSDVTGQDGISITLGLNQSMTIVIDDTDGLANVASAPVAATADGIIQIGDGVGAGQEMTMNGTASINIDAGGDGTDGVLVVGISLASGFAINTGDISVGTSLNNGALGPLRMNAYSVPPAARSQISEHSSLITTPNASSSWASKRNEFTASTPKSCSNCSETRPSKISC